MSAAKGFCCHVENGGLRVKVEQNNPDETQYLTASWSHYGNPGPEARIPLLTVAQVEAMISLLESAKKNITSDHSFEVNLPKQIG